MIALERDETATALVQRVMSEWIESYDAEPRTNPRAYTVTEPVETVTEHVETPTAKLGAVIVSKEQAAAAAVQMAAAKGVEFKPVPKPVAKKKPSRR